MVCSKYVLLTSVLLFTLANSAYGGFYFNDYGFDSGYYGSFYNFYGFGGFYDYFGNFGGFYDVFDYFGSFGGFYDYFGSFGGFYDFFDYFGSFGGFYDYFDYFGFGGFYDYFDYFGFGGFYDYFGSFFNYFNYFDFYDFYGGFYNFDFYDFGFYNFDFYFFYNFNFNFDFYNFFQFFGNFFDYYYYYYYYYLEFGGVIAPPLPYDNPTVFSNVPTPSKSPTRSPVASNGNTGNNGNNNNAPPPPVVLPQPTSAPINPGQCIGCGVGTAQAIVPQQPGGGSGGNEGPSTKVPLQATNGERAGAISIPPGISAAAGTDLILDVSFVTGFNANNNNNNNNDVFDDRLGSIIMDINLYDSFGNPITELVEPIEICIEQEADDVS